MITQDNVEQYLNGVVTDESGDKIGNVGDIYFDDQTDKPSWVTVNTGLFGNKSSFIPLENASFDGDQIRVPFSKDKVKDAPHFGDDGHISEEEERELFRYYGQDYDAGWTDGDRDRTRDADGDVDADRRRAADTDTEGVVRHEEQLNVGTREREAGRVRLRKYVTTEEKTVTVPVQREEVRVVREPIAEGDRGVDLGDAKLGEDSTEVILHEEEVVVEKKAVPVERVGLQKETFTDEKQVTEQVRSEHIDVDQSGDVERGTGRRVSDEDYRDTNYDGEGYNRAGYNQEGFDRDGLDRDGRDRHGKPGLVDRIKDKLDRDNDGHVG